MGLSDLRNLAIVAHIDAGKTTTTERILHCAGVEVRVGRVDDGTAVMDWMDEERERGITITSAATHFEWRGVEFNLIDTPGHVDFTVEVERCMRVLDGAILVIDAVSGVQAQTETVWRQLRAGAVPAICFVNKCDRVGADYLAAVESVQRRLGVPSVPIQYPIHADGALCGVVDVVSMCAWRFDAEGGAVRGEIPAEVRDEVEVLRLELLDALAAEDDGLLSVWVEGREPDAEALVAALRQRVLSRSLLPVLCGASLRGIGVQPLLDAAVAYLPSPLDRPPIQGFDAEGAPGVTRAADPDGPLAALVFKLHTTAHGDQAFLRIYSGQLAPGDKVWNPRTLRFERIARVLRMHADRGEGLERAGAGAIVAVTGLKATGTGDTLCDPEHGIRLEPPYFPEPVIALMVEPVATDGREALAAALARLAHEDPSFRCREDEDTGQWRIEGMGELHLDVQVHRLRREFKLDVRVGNPRVAYRESVRGASRGAARVERELGGRSVFGAVELELAEDPGAPSARLEGVEWGSDCAVPVPFRAAVEGALVSEAETGPAFGFPLVGCRIRIEGGESGEHDAELGFVQAAVQALRSALDRASLVLLEPRMAFEILTPEAFASGVIADLGGRSASVDEVLSDRDLRILRGHVPLAHMLGYATVVRSLSQGRASFSMSPDGFGELPASEHGARGLTWT